MANHATDTVTPVDGQDISTFDGDPHLEETHKAMADAGVQIETRHIIDYWSFSETFKFYLPQQDGVAEEYKQYISYEKMNEEKKSEYQRKTNKNIRIQNTTKDIKMDMDPANDRHVLLEISVTGWKMFRTDYKGNQVETAFDQRSWAEFLRKADPKIIQDLEADIRKRNPWMMAELTVEEIDREIDNLKEQREQVVKLKAEK